MDWYIGCKMSSLRIKLRSSQPQCSIPTTVWTRHDWKPIIYSSCKIYPTNKRFLSALPITTQNIYRLIAYSWKRSILTTLQNLHLILVLLLFLHFIQKYCKIINHTHVDKENTISTIPSPTISFTFYSYQSRITIIIKSWDISS